MPEEKHVGQDRRVAPLRAQQWKPTETEATAQPSVDEAAEVDLEAARAEAFFSGRFAEATDSAAETQELHPLDRLASTHPIVRQAVLVAAALLVGALVAWAAWGYSA